MRNDGPEDDDDERNDDEPAEGRSGHAPVNVSGLFGLQGFVELHLAHASAELTEAQPILQYSWLSEASPAAGARFWRDGTW
jgi:hypothetical protein